MKLKFKTQDFQTDVVSAVADLFIDQKWRSGVQLHFCEGHRGRGGV